MRKTSCIPSGEIASVCAPCTEKKAPGGGVMEKRTTLVGCAVERLVKLARAKPTASSSTAIAQARMTCRSFAARALGMETEGEDSAAAESFPAKALSRA